MKNTKSLSVMVLFGLATSLPALANWSAAVTHSEVIFGCNGTTPTTLPLAVNVSAGSHGEYRLPDYAVATFLKDASIAPATCTVDDSGESAHPSWNPVQLPVGTTVYLNFSTEVSTCSYDVEQGGYHRDNQYTLNVIRAGKASEAFGWTETVHFSSPTACSDLL